MQTKVKPKRQILLIDDEKSLTQVLSMLLETKGYEVVVANSAQEAFKKVNIDLDLILLDLILPDLHGFEICRRLKRSKDTRHIPIIMISAHDLQEDRVEGLYLGADDFLSKPCEREELFARMAAVMRRNEELNNSRDQRQENVIVELRRILDQALIIPFFQPIYKLDPFELFGVEILTHPVVNSILSCPEDLFKAAMEYGMYTELEMLAWSKALRILSRHINNKKIFLNCNPYFIESSQCLGVRAMFDRYGIPPQNIIIEITERSAISNFDLFFEQLGNYRQYGFNFAVDDVGGGYASLESIIETKPDFVKIDRHIIKGLANDSFKRSVIKFFVSLCREHRMTAIAEGIETAEDLKIIKVLGVDAGQGYFLYKPTSHPDQIDFKGNHTSKIFFPRFEK